MQPLLCTEALSAGRTTQKHRMPCERARPSGAIKWCAARKVAKYVKCCKAELNILIDLTDKKSSFGAAGPASRTRVPREQAHFLQRFPPPA
jgi:hypothetical protein